MSLVSVLFVRVEPENRFRYNKRKGGTFRHYILYIIYDILYDNTLSVPVYVLSPLIEGIEGLVW